MELPTMPSVAESEYKHVLVVDGDQEDYQAQVDLFEGQLPTVTDKAKLPLYLANYLNAHICDLIVLRGNALERREAFCNHDSDWLSFMNIIVDTLQRDKESRCQLVQLPSKSSRERNILVCRLGPTQNHPDWDTLLLLSERKAPPVTMASPLFITRDFAVAQAVADAFLEVSDHNATIDSPLYTQVDLVRKELSRELGNNVAVTFVENSCRISGIRPPKEYGHLTARALAQLCVGYLYGMAAVEQIALFAKRSTHTRAGTIDEFGICPQTRGELGKDEKETSAGLRVPVYGALVTVTVLPAGSNAEVVIPRGWWWQRCAKTPRVSAVDAEAKVWQEEEKQGRHVLEAKTESTCIWPYGVPGTIVHVIGVKTSEGRSSRYFVDAESSSLVYKRCIRRCEPALKEDK